MRFMKAFRLLAALFVVTVAGSCTGDIATAPQTPVVQSPAPEVNPDLIGGLLGTTTQLVGTLLTCTPQPFAANQAWIGPNGGTLRLGANTLVVPRGALTRTILIRGEVPTDPVASVRFSPEGLEFERSVYLTLSYQHCNLIAGLLTPKRIAYTSERLRILEFVPTVDNILARKVTGQLDHFSRYAVAW